MISIEDCEGRPKDTDLAAKNILHRVSVKSILVGGLVDIGLSLGLGIPLALYELSKVGTTGVYNEHIVGSSGSSPHNVLALRLWQLGIGLACSVLGGYVAARLAKHDELLNGTLSSILCVALGVFTISAGRSSDPLLVQVVLFSASPALGFVGAWLWIMQKRTRAT